MSELDNEFRTKRLFLDGSGSSDKIEFHFVDSENRENGTMLISLTDPDDELFDCLTEFMLKKMILVSPMELSNE